jgi:hypothetical protein
VPVAKILIPLTILAAVFTTGLSILAVHGHRFGAEGAELLWTFEFRILLAFWVRIDRKVRSFRLPFEFDAFVFFAWPVAVPYYLYRTRSSRGLLLTAAIYVLYLAPNVVANIIRLTR